MARKFKLLGREIIIGKDLSIGAGRSSDYYQLIQSRYGVDYKLRNKLDAYRNIVYACVSLIAEQCATYKPILLRRKGDQLEDIGDHELLRLLRRPAGQELDAESFSQFDLFEATSSYQLLQGDCFWYMALGSSTGKPREIVVLRPDKVGTDVAKDGTINGYFIRRDYGEPVPLEVNEVLRFPFFNPKDYYKGMGVVEAGSDYIGTDESTAKFTKNFFDNNAGLSGVLSINGEVSKNAFRKFSRAWREKYEGVDNAGKTAIIRDTDANFTKVGLGLDELDMSELRKMTLDDVLLLFKVPLPLLGKADQTGLGRGNVETLEYIFAKYNIDAKFKRFDAVLQFALERYWGETDIIISHENIIPKDKEFELSERDKAVDRWLTRDEIRDEEGLDSVSGGDQLFVPLANIPIGEAPPEPEAKTIKLKIIRKVKADEAEPINFDNKEKFRLSLMRNQSLYERRYKKKFKPIIVAQRKEALTNLEAHGAAIKQADYKLFDDAAADAKMVEELSPLLIDLTEQQGGLALVFAGDTDNEFKLTASMQRFVQEGTRRMATNFNDETLTLLNNTLAEGITNGEGIDKLKKRINAVYDDVEGYRAERIARTETLKASNSATQWAYEQTGYVKAKQWVVNPNACPRCGEFNGKTVPLSDDFLGLGESYTYTDENGDEKTVTNDYDTVQVPPLHPNCRCTIIPVR